MKNIFLFSDSLRQFGKYLKFQSLKFRKWIFILFKRNRKLHKISFDYYKNWQFEHGLLVINFQFKNAIWYKIGDYKSLDFIKPIFLNLQNTKSDLVVFEVYGFFQKQVYYIKLNKATKIDNQPFNTKIFNISELTIMPNQIFPQMTKPIIKVDKPKVKISGLSVESISIEIIPSKFKTQDYI
ncbi:MAG: hypothetical protein JJE55_14200 [Flavobacteriaceae bacterium]|nr:hypothetical protein [Flavobacteriaceae bacterium]